MGTLPRTLLTQLSRALLSSPHARAALRLTIAPPSLVTAAEKVRALVSLRYGTGAGVAA